jgi:hypothetical protein
MISYSNFHLGRITCNYISDLDHSDAQICRWHHGSWEWGLGRGSSRYLQTGLRDFHCRNVGSRSTCSCHDEEESTPQTCSQDGMNPFWFWFSDPPVVPWCGIECCNLFVQEIWCWGTIWLLRISYYDICTVSWPGSRHSEIWWVMGDGCGERFTSTHRCVNPPQV